MKLRHAAALSLAGWYLMTPPVFRPSADHPRAYTETGAPVSEWSMRDSYDLVAECKKARDQLRANGMKATPGLIDPDGASLAIAQANQYAECVATDDPRLKAK